MSNLGMHTLYFLLNKSDKIVAERFFVPKGELLSSHLRSLESNRPAQDFDLLLFTISFETDYLNCVRFLKLAGFPPYSKDRGNDLPLVLAGGVATFINPEPLAPFMDAFLLGEFEGLVEPFSEHLPELLDFSVDKGERLKGLALNVPGTYVPQGYRVIYDDSRSYKGHLPEEKNLPSKIRPAKLTDPPETVPHTVVVTPETVFPETFLIELTRGCGMGCRFCAAGYVYRPPRAWPMSAVQNAIRKAEQVAKIGLIGLEYTSRPDIENLATLLMKEGKKIGFSSLRADLITPSFARLLKESGTKMATIAPEAGSQRMRDIINKNLSEDEILESIRRLSSEGTRNFKLYFMIGLPLETDDDVVMIAALTEKIHKVMLSHARKRGRIGTISVSVNQFVPKPWTPFQWSDFCSEKEIKRRIKLLKSSLRSIPNLKVSLPSYRHSMLQAILSRGDRRVSKLIELMALKGSSLKQSLKETGLSAEQYLKGRQLDAPLPWEIIDHPVRREFLLHEWRKAARQHLSRPCNILKCRRCDACSILVTN